MHLGTGHGRRQGRHRSSWPYRPKEPSCPFALASAARRAAAVLFSVVTVAGLVTPAAAAAPPATSSVGGASFWAGWPVHAEPLPPDLWLPGTGSAYRLRYTSTGHDGGVAIVSGAVFVPVGARPPGGWPVISWAHGTVGVADVCAPSTSGRTQRDVDYLSAWLGAGYAIVATDYEGLGTAGPHPYLHGESEAHATIDIARAARRLDPRLSRRWMAVGQSQGAQAAMFAAALVDEYAPATDFRAAIATGMPSQWQTTVAAAGVFVPQAPANPLVIDIVAGLEVIAPDAVEPFELFTPAGAELYEQALTVDCFPARATAVAGLTVADVYAIDTVESEQLLSLLGAEDIPIEAYATPVFIGQGTNDRVVYPPASQTTAQLLAAAGTDVTFRFYPGADHNTTLQAALADVLAYAETQFA